MTSLARSFLNLEVKNRTVIPGKNCFKMQTNKVKLSLDLTTFLRRGSFPGEGEGRGGPCGRCSLVGCRVRRTGRSEFWALRMCKRNKTKLTEVKVHEAWKNTEQWSKEQMVYDRTSLLRILTWKSRLCFKPNDPLWSLGKQAWNERNVFKGKRCDKQQGTSVMTV